MEFRILGRVEVIHDGRVVAVGGSRERAVLALLLASANRVVSAERLADDLWVGEPPARAVQTLQVFVSRLRKALREAGMDGVIVTQPPGYLAHVPPESLDAARFESLVAAAREHSGSGAPDRAAGTLRDALALWRGPALADVADGPITRAEAARLEEARLTATEERVNADLACGRHAELIAELDALTRAHPLRERLWSQRMLALYRSGRQVEALRAYRDLRQYLAEEVGLEPSPALAALETAILQQAPHLEWMDAVPAAGPSPASPTPSSDRRPAGGPVFAARTPYVGREHERAECAGWLREACKGQGALVLIGGEPGVGKTRFTEMAAADADSMGAQVLVGRCYEIDGAPPYVPFVEILEQALAAAASPAAFRAFLRDDAPEVAKLLPVLRRLFTDIPPPLELPTDVERHFLFNSIRDVLSRGATARPLFLVFEDLHWADEGTLLLLEHLAEHIPQLAVLAVGTYRDTEVTPDHRLARSLEDLRRRNLVSQVSLKRLPEEGVAALLGALSGQAPPAAFVGAVYAETHGNPFFTEEVFKHLAEEGRLYDEDGRFRAEVTIKELEVPESLRLVLGRRLERLGENGRRALAAAAVVGRAFTYELLEALGEIAAEPLLDALEEAERARLIAPLSDAAEDDRLLFSHELIRQTLLAGLTPPRRRRLHLLVADTLERRYATTLDEQASEIAHHLTQAGPAADRRRLLNYLTLAGRQAMRTASGEDALRHFDQAVAMVDVAEGHEEPRLFADRARALRTLGRMDEALPDWDRARAGYAALDDPEEAARMAYEASFDLLWINRDEEALITAEEALAMLGQRETPLRARILAGTGNVGAYVRPYGHGAERIDEAIELAERLGDKRLAGYCLSNRAQHRFAFAQFGEVVESGQEAVRLLRGEGDLWEATTVLAFMECSAYEMGRGALAAELGEEVERLATQLNHAFVLLFIHAPLMSSRQLAASPDLEVLEASVSTYYETVAPMGFGAMAGGFKTYAAFLRGDWNEALHRAEEAVAQSLPRPHHGAGIEWGCYLLVLAYLDRGEEVVALLDEDRFDLPEPGRPNGFAWWYGLVGAIEALAVIGERDRAASLYPLIRELKATTGATVALGPPYHLYDRIAGIAAAARRHWDMAEEHFRAALRQAEELPSVIEGAETRRWYARMLLERDAPGDGDRARTLVEEAMPIYERVGMPRHVELARRLLST
jgi:DNA-binding SARP family transcriptional activator